MTYQVRYLALAGILAAFFLNVVARGLLRVGGVPATLLVAAVIAIPLMITAYLRQPTLGISDVVGYLVFGIAVTFIALQQGFEASPTPEGVSRATTRTVVMASLAVLGLDFVLTALMFSI